MSDVWMTVPEAARRYGVRTVALRQAEHAGAITGRRRDGTVELLVADLEARWGERMCGCGATFRPTHAAQTQCATCKKTAAGKADSTRAAVVATDPETFKPPHVSLLTRADITSCYGLASSAIAYAVKTGKLTQRGPKGAYLYDTDEVHALWGPRQCERAACRAWFWPPQHNSRCCSDTCRQAESDRLTG